MSFGTAVDIGGVVLLVYLGLLNLVYLVLTLIAAREITSYRRQPGYHAVEEDLVSPLTPGISVILPAFNEEAGVENSVRSLLALRYPLHEVIVVSDGSTDGTVEVLRDAFALYPIRAVSRAGIPTAAVRCAYASTVHPNLLVVDKDNGGKADAINAGIGFAHHPFFCAMDADALLEQDALLSVAKPLIDDPDRVAATGGIVRIANGCRVENGSVVEASLPRNRLAVLQVVEYFRAFLVGRVGWSRMNALLIVSGAFGVFRRQIVEEVGGYATDTVGEDMELVMRIHHHLGDLEEPYRIVFVADPVCWTEAPEDLRVFMRQRRRWQRGLAESLWRHREMLLRPRYGAAGMFAVPYFWLFELIGPVISTAGYVFTPILFALGLVSVTYLLAFATLAVLVGILLSVSALALEEWSFRRHPRNRDIARMVLWGILENLGYRQLNDLIRSWALVQLIAGRGGGWGAMPRKGIGRQPA